MDEREGGPPCRHRKEVIRMEDLSILMDILRNGVWLVVGICTLKRGTRQNKKQSRRGPTR